MPVIINDDGAEQDTGTGAVTDPPDHMAPADRPGWDGNLPTPKAKKASKKK